MKAFLISLGVVLLIIFFMFTGTYNSLVSMQTEVQTQRAQIESQLQRRFDLVPNLVGAVKGAMKQEQAVFKAIADARTKYAGTAPGSTDRLQAAGQYEGALARLLVVMENYPQLRSIDTVQNLMVQLEGTENRISVSRQRYNESVQTYNRALRTFPTNIIGGMFGFDNEPFFQSQTGADKAPKVDL